MLTACLWSLPVPRPDPHTGHPPPPIHTCKPLDAHESPACTTRTAPVGARHISPPVVARAAQVGAFVSWYMFDSFMGIDLSKDGHTTVTWHQLTHWQVGGRVGPVVSLLGGRQPQHGPSVHVIHGPRSCDAHTCNDPFSDPHIRLAPATCAASVCAASLCCSQPRRHAHGLHRTHVQLSPPFCIAPPPCTAGVREVGELHGRALHRRRADRGVRRPLRVLHSEAKHALHAQHQSAKAPTTGSRRPPLARRISCSTTQPPTAPPASH